MGAKGRLRVNRASSVSSVAGERAHVPRDHRFPGWPWQAQRWATMRRMHWHFHALAATEGVVDSRAAAQACYASAMALILAHSRWLRFGSFGAFYFAQGVPLGQELAAGAS